MDRLHIQKRFNDLIRLILSGCPVISACITNYLVNLRLGGGRSKGFTSFFMALGIVFYWVNGNSAGGVIPRLTETLRYASR